MNHCELEEMTHHINEKISTIKQLLELRAVTKDPDKQHTLLKIDHEVDAINTLLDQFERHVGQQKNLLKHLKDLEAFFQQDVEDVNHLKNNMPAHLPRRVQQAAPHEGQLAAPSRQTDAPSAPHEQGPPRKPPRNQIKEMKFITVLEFDSIPSYMKGRVTYDQLNAAVQGINTAVTAKYKILHQPAKTLNNTSRALHQCFKGQETKDTKGQFFIVEKDIEEFSQLKVDKRFVGMLNMLRHCQRLKEVRGGGLLRYILL